jgi:hypothetical protein
MAESGAVANRCRDGRCQAAGTASGERSSTGRLSAKLEPQILQALREVEAADDCIELFCPRRRRRLARRQQFDRSALQGVNRGGMLAASVIVAPRSWLQIRMDITTEVFSC